MNIINLSLAVIFVCCVFIVVCSILDKLELFPSTKGILCFLMLGIIGVWSGGLHDHTNGAMSIVFVTLAVWVVQQTTVSYKRGFV